MPPRPAASKPCRQCPFRTDSLPGYLGEYPSAADFIGTHYRADVPAPCHTSLDYERPDAVGRFMRGKAGKLCAGQAQLYRNSCKKPRPPSPISPPEQPSDEVFTWAHDFIAHHGGPDAPRR